MTKNTLAALPAEMNWHEYFKIMQQQAKDPLLKDFYSVGVIDENTPISEVEFVALDFETTGLNHKKDGIISIGLIPFTLRRIYCSQSKYWLVKPRKTLQESSVVIHGITHSDLSDAPDLKRILDEVLEALKGKIVVVHYQFIERQFFDQALKTRIDEGILFPMIDTLAIDYELQQGSVNGFWQRLFRKKAGSVRLGACRERYHLPVYPPHDALIDAIATAELFQAQVAHHFTPETPIKALWC